MKKSTDVEFYRNHDFGDEMREAVDSGRGLVGENMTTDGFLAMVRARRAAERAERASRAVTIRIPVRVIDGYKAKAASEGIKYQTLMNEVLEAALA